MTPPNARGLARLGPRGTFGMSLLSASHENDRIVGITADLAITAGLERFRFQRPERLLNVGIAEQNLVGVASGMAADGWQPFAVTFANFAAMRSCEFVRHHLGYMRQPVTLVGIGAGFAMGQFGTTHYSLEDVSVLRAIPNLTIISPGDCSEVWAAVDALASSPRPAYLRLSGAPSMRQVDQSDSCFEIGRARVISRGRDVTFIATGSMLSVAVASAANLAERGLSVGVINMHTLKPIDSTAIEYLLGETAAIVTIEEHSTIGGLGAAVAEVLASFGQGPPLLRLGVDDTFPGVGSYEWVLRECGLTDVGATSAVVEWVKNGHTGAGPARSHPERK